MKKVVTLPSLGAASRVNCVTQRINAWNLFYSGTYALLPPSLLDGFAEKNKMTSVELEQILYRMDDVYPALKRWHTPFMTLLGCLLAATVTTYFFNREISLVLGISLALISILVPGAWKILFPRKIKIMVQELEADIKFWINTVHLENVRYADSAPLMIPTDHALERVLREETSSTSAKSAEMAATAATEKPPLSMNAIERILNQVHSPKFGRLYSISSTLGLVTKSREDYKENVKPRRAAVSRRRLALVP